MLQFRRSVLKPPDYDAKELVTLMSHEASRGVQSAAVPRFYCSDDVVFREFSGQHIRQAMWRSMAAIAYTSITGSSKGLLMIPFREQRAAVALDRNGRFFQLISKSDRRKPESHFVNVAPLLSLRSFLSSTACRSSTTAYRENP